MRSLGFGLLVVAAAARGDSRDPSQAAPATVLGRVAVEGGRAIADGIDVAVVDNRLGAKATARFRVEAPPGPHAITVEAPTTGVTATWNGQPLPLERSDGKCAPLDAGAVGIDPEDGARYPLSPSENATCEVKRAVVDGSGTLALTHELTAGYDRLRRRRTMAELAHLFANRKDYFVYHFALAGAGGPVAVRFPARTDGTWRWDGALLRISATEKRHFPVGATLAVGVAWDAGGLHVAARATVDALLPWGDALAFSVDGDHSLRATLALTYHWFSRWLAFWPVGAHLEAGPVLDVVPTVRAGGRAGIGGWFNCVLARVSVDVLPSSAPGRAVDLRLLAATGIGF